MQQPPLGQEESFEEDRNTCSAVTQHNEVVTLACSILVYELLNQNSNEKYIFHFVIPDHYEILFVHNCSAIMMSVQIWYECSQNGNILKN